MRAILIYKLRAFMLAVNELLVYTIFEIYLDTEENYDLFKMWLKLR